jgi:putative transposase
MEFEDNTKTRNHYKGELNYHIIFSTKFRRKCLAQIEDELYEAFMYCESKSHFKIKKMKHDKDHIHLLVNIAPIYSLGQTISRMKQMTTSFLYRNETTRNWLRNFYWGKRLTIWTHGYYASTVGKVNEKTIYDYIENQGKK